MRSRISTSVFVLFCALAAIGPPGCSEGGDQSEDATREDPIVLNSIDETKEFVQEHLAKPIPADYEIPKYISSGLPREQVYDSLESRYPEFYGLQGESFLSAIMKNPGRYLEMTLENKAIRRYYDPNSQY